MLERFDLDSDEDRDGNMHVLGLEPAEHGEWVRYADAQRELDAQAARIAELEAQLWHVISCYAKVLVEKALRGAP